jgi:hypothetical protein
MEDVVINKTKFENNCGMVCSICCANKGLTSCWCMLLIKFEVPNAHYLETRHFSWHPIYILCSVETLILLVVLLQRKK